MGNQTKSSINEKTKYERRNNRTNQHHWIQQGGSDRRNEERKRNLRLKEWNLAEDDRQFLSTWILDRWSLSLALTFHSTSNPPPPTHPPRSQPQPKPTTPISTPAKTHQPNLNPIKTVAEHHRYPPNQTHKTHQIMTTIVNHKPLKPNGKQISFKIEAAWWKGEGDDAWVMRENQKMRGRVTKPTKSWPQSLTINPWSLIESRWVSERKQHDEKGREMMPRLWGRTKEREGEFKSLRREWIRKQ